MTLAIWLVAQAIMVGAGDIAKCGPDFANAKATAALLALVPGTVFTLGDNAYGSGSALEYWQCYEPTWGKFKRVTRPALGNHDIGTLNGGPYFDYFGENAGPKGVGYYAYNNADWRVIVLDSNKATDPLQEQWLVEELAEHPAPCALAYFHHPVWSSGPHGNTEAMRPLWGRLVEAKVEIVVSGHDHLYERFRPMNAAGTFDVTGPEAFVVGTGGAALYDFRLPTRPNSARRIKRHGVLVLLLQATRYDYGFLTTDLTVPDRGGRPCQ